MQVKAAEQDNLGSFQQDSRSFSISTENIKITIHTSTLKRSDSCHLKQETGKWYETGMEFGELKVFIERGKVTEK